MSSIFAQLLLSFGIGNLLLTEWRLNYFGFPFPNTYYIKMTDGFFENLKEGLIYFGKYATRVNPLIVVTIAIFLLWSYRFTIRQTNSKKNAAIILPVLLFSVLGLCIPFLTGGDHFRLARFYQVFCPVIYLTFIFILYDFKNENSFIEKLFCSKKRVVFIVLLLSFLPLKNWYILALNPKYTILTEFNIARYNRDLGQQLNAFFPNKKPSIAVVAAGGIAYTYKGYVNDVLGLNNSEVAHTFTDRPTNLLKSHRAFNKSVFLKQEPDLFLFEIVSDSSRFIPYSKRINIDEQFGSKVIKHIYKDAEFNKIYQYEVFQFGRFYLYSYISRKYLNDNPLKHKN